MGRFTRVVGGWTRARGLGNTASKAGGNLDSRARLIDMAVYCADHCVSHVVLLLNRTMIASGKLERWVLEVLGTPFASPTLEEDADCEGTAIRCISTPRD